MIKLGEQIFLYEIKKFLEIKGNFYLRSHTEKVRKNYKYENKNIYLFIYLFLKCCLISKERKTVYIISSRISYVNREY